MLPSCASSVAAGQATSGCRGGGQGGLRSQPEPLDRRQNGYEDEAADWDLRSVHASGRMRFGGCCLRDRRWHVRACPTASTVASSARAPASSADAAARCRRPASLPAGAAVQAWRLGAIRFVSDGKGVALTAPQIQCDVQLRHGRGTEVYSRPQPVRLATTSDAGRQWVTSGIELPAAPLSTEVEQVAAADGDRTWVVSLTGTLLATGNAGASWVVQPLPGPVLAAGSASGWLWALSCPPVTSNSCRPEVERMKLPTGTWVASRPASPTSRQVPQFDVLSATAAVVVLQGIRPALASTTDGGARWTVRAAPAGPENICRDPSPLILRPRARATGGCCAPAAQLRVAAPRH
jgi:hypothetical protein